MRANVTRVRPALALLCGATLLLAGCYQRMADQPRLRTLGASSFFADGRASRPIEPGTVARGLLHDDPGFYEGKKGGSFWEQFGEPASQGYVNEFPFEVTESVLARGRERFNIFCAVCHDRAGLGKGMIVQRGFLPPPNFHKDDSRGLAFLGEKGVKLREVPVGYIFSVITRGYGAMATYSAQLTPADRWAVVAHVRALQHAAELAQKEGEK